MRLLAIFCLACVTTLGPSRAWARGVDGAEVGRNLLARGHELLRRAEGHYFRKDLASARRDGKEAERIFEVVLNQEPTNRGAAMLAGQAATVAGDRAAAVRWVDRFRKLSPLADNDPELHYLIAFVQLLGEKRPERAIRSLMRMYSLDPRERPVARDNLWYLALSEHGRNLVSAGQHDEAHAQFRVAARIAKRMGNRAKELMMLANIGVSLMQSDRYIEAIDVFAGLTKAEKLNPLWHYRLGLCYAAQSQFAEAVPVYREVIRLREAGHSYPGVEAELRQVHLRLGNCLRHLAENQVDPKLTADLFREAEELIRHYVGVAPDDPAGHKWLGVMLFENLDRPYEALGYFARAFELDEICDGMLRYMIQIRRNFPPPTGVSVEAWQAPLAKWAKDLEEGTERRRAVKKERRRLNGSDGCA